MRSPRTGSRQLRPTTVWAALAVVALVAGCARGSVVRSPSSSALVPSSAPAPSSAPVSSSSVTASPVTTFGTPQRTGGGALPWAGVGPGWFLVEEDASTRSPTDMSTTDGLRTLWLVDPTGRKYLVLQWAAGSAPTAGLVDWSPLRRHALFSAADDAVFDVDLMTGAARGFAAPHLVAARYTPSGADIAALVDDPAADPSGRNGVLRVYAADGVAQPTLADDVDMLADSWSHWLYSRDGATVYLADAGGLRVVAASGGPARSFDRIEPGTVACSPVRWWDDHTILVSCDEPAAPRLWLAPDNGGGATPLTAPFVPDPSRAQDWGAFDAVRTSTGQVFVQRPTSCGGVDIAALDGEGHATRVAIPGSMGIDWLVGAAGKRLAVRSTTTEDCYPRGWFGFYDAVANKVQRVIDDPPDELGAVAAVAFARDESSN
jgi:hypothetical protein